MEHLGVVNRGSAQGLKWRETVRDEPFHLKNVFVRLSEGTLAVFLNALLRDYPALMLGSYPEFTNPEYRVKVTLESKDATYLAGALRTFLERLPADAVVRVT